MFTNESQILDPRKNLSRKILREFTVKSNILSFAFLDRIQKNGGLQTFSWFSPICAILKTIIQTSWNHKLRVRGQQFLAQHYGGQKECLDSASIIFLMNLQVQHILCSAYWFFGVCCAPVLLASEQRVLLNKIHSSQ